MYFVLSSAYFQCVAKKEPMSTPAVANVGQRTKKAASNLLAVMIDVWG
jgi:hypothetical protein